MAPSKLVEILKEQFIEIPMEDLILLFCYIVKLAKPRLETT